MKLILFATPHENPFDIKLEKGIVTPYNGMFLLLAGIGMRAAQRLETALAAHSAVTGVLECGGAAAVHDAMIGEHYTVTRLFTTDGRITGAPPPIPGLPRAAAVCDTTIYRGEGFPWSAAAGLPLLYTMETAALFDLCKGRDIPFHSIRLATDDGRGDIRNRYQQTLVRHREETTGILRTLGEI